MQIYPVMMCHTLSQNAALAPQLSNAELKYSSKCVNFERTWVIGCKKQTPSQTLHHNMASSCKLIETFTTYRDVQLEINVKGVPDSEPWDGSLNIVVQHGDHAAVVFRKDTLGENSPGMEHAEGTLTGEMWMLDLRHVDKSGDNFKIYYRPKGDVPYKKLIRLCGIKDVGFSIPGIWLYNLCNLFLD